MDFRSTRHLKLKECAMCMYAHLEDPDPDLDLDPEGNFLKSRAVKIASGAACKSGSSSTSSSSSSSSRFSLLTVRRGGVRRIVLARYIKMHSFAYRLLPCCVRARAFSPVLHFFACARVYVLLVYLRMYTNVCLPRHHHYRPTRT